MTSIDVDVLLKMVGDMDLELDRYLAGSSGPSEAVPRILEACQQMRAMELDAAAQYWLRSIEHHATEIRNPRPRSRSDGALFSSGDLMDSQLLKDIYNLRLQLLNARSSIH